MRQTNKQVTHGHFRSCDKDVGHTIRSAVVKDPMLHSNLVALSFSEPEIWAIEVYIAEQAFCTFSAPVTDPLHV